MDNVDMGIASILVFVALIGLFLLVDAVAKLIWRAGK
jgi:hypothetical protein